MKVLLTGATSFVGSHLAERILDHTDWDICSLERLPGPRRRCVRGPADSPRVRRFYHDLSAPLPGRILDRLAGVDYVVHMAAEVSGIRSITDPGLAVQASILGTFNSLEVARALKPRRFVFVSSGEAVGPLPAPDAADERAPLRPSNPYAAAKAGAEELVRAWHLSFGVPSVTVRSMCLFGPGQGPGRFVPDTVKAILAGDVVRCHVDPDGKPGRRSWLHIGRFTAALLPLVIGGEAGETFHVVGPEMSNLEVINTLALALNREVRIETVVPGTTHDHRYALKDTQLGGGASWRETAGDLARTARWYRENPEWLNT